MITVDRKQFSRALALATTVVERRSSIPILSTVKLVLERLSLDQAKQLNDLPATHNSGEILKPNAVQQPDMTGVDRENAAWAWLDQKFGTADSDPVDRTYDASEMVDAFHAGHDRRLSHPTADAVAVGRWQPIETCEATGQAEAVIVAVTCPDREAVVGEAWRADDGEWWWAGTIPNGYHDDPISETNFGKVTDWMPLPEAPPAIRSGGAS